MDELSKRLQACIVVEKTAADIYRKLAKYFPHEKSFFLTLFHEEEDHVAILSMGKLYKMVSQLPESIVPESFPMIAETIALGNEIISRIDAEDISLKEALELTLRLEKSIAEEHLQEILKIDHDDETLQKLKRLKAEDATHAERISVMLQRKGLQS